MQHCNDCNRDKDESEFYNTSHAPRDCKECLRRRDKLKYDSRTPEQIEARKQYDSSRYRIRKAARKSK